MLTESNETKLIEIAHVGGLPTFLFRETKNSVLKDGVEIATNYHRESYPATGDEAKTILGEALADSLAQAQALTTETLRKDELLAILIEENERVCGELAQALAQLADLQAAAAKPADHPPVD